MVMRLMPSIMSVSRAATNRNRPTPPSVMRMGPHSAITAPSWMTNRFRTEATATMSMSGASERRALPGGMLDAR